ncbi:MAG: OmpA family protein [Cyclobacteriaceae bacterium]
MIGQPITLLIEMGDKYAEANDHQRAIGVYKAVLETDDTNIAAQYKIAESYRAILDYEMAEGYYLKVKRRNDGRFILAAYYYPLMKKLNGDYQEALENFEEFMLLLKEKDQHEDPRYRHYYEQARIEREGTLIALNEISVAQPEHQFTILPKPVNSEDMDSAPSTYLNDSTIVISSGRKGGKGSGQSAFGGSWNDLYRFSKVGNNWSEVKTRDDFDIVNDKFDDAAGMFNQDRTKFYFTRCVEASTNVVNCFIYVSKLQKGEWTDPIKLNPNINVQGSNSRQACITVSGDSLFFCSDRDGGVGGYDIYLSTKFGDENWGPAQHLGAQINTPFTESSPFYDHNDRALYFSSDGHRGFGGFDIYLADGSSFEKAEIYNVGAPFNSNKDDMFFFMGKHKGYVSSNRKGGVGKMDIYTFNISTEKDMITEIESDEAIAGRNSLFSDDYDFDSDNDEMLSEIISHLMASNVSNIEMALTNEQLSFYNSLSKDDQERIDRIVNARVRNLSQNDLQAIRDEDEFFYSHMTSEDKRHVDNLVSAYVREDGLGLSIAIDQQETNFYEELPVSDKEKVDMIIAARMKQAHDFTYPMETYDKLDQQSQQSVDQLSYKVISEKKNIQNMALAFNENLFLRNNQNSPDVVNNSIKEKIYNLADDPKFELKEEDRIFYQNLDSRQLEALNNIASSIILNDVNDLEKNISKEDRAIYASFSGNQKQQLDKILSKIINNTVKADLYLGEVNFEKNELAVAKLNRDIEAAFNFLKANDQALFSTFNEDKERAIKRFISVADPWVDSPDNIYLPEREVTQPTNLVNRGPMISDVRAGASANPRMDRSTTAAQNNQTTGPGSGTTASRVTTISNANISAYENLSSDEKAAVNRSIAANLLNKAYSANPNLPVSDDSFVASLNSTQKSYINVLAKHLAGTPLSETERSLLLSAQSYYDHLPMNEKAIWSRSIAKEVLKGNRIGNEYSISERDRNLIAGLSTMEKSALSEIESALLNDQSLTFGQLANKAKNTSEQAPVGGISNELANNFSLVNVSGKLLLVGNQAPIANKVVNLVSSNGVVIQQVTTKPDGSFLFTNVPNADYQVEFNDPNDIPGDAFLSNLTVKGTGATTANSNDPGNPITQEDVNYYRALTTDKKHAIDLGIAATLLNDIYAKSPQVALSDQTYFNTLSEREQEYVRILAKDLNGEPIQESEYLLKATADSYYTHLIPVEQPFWNRLIAAEALKNNKNGNQYTVSAKDQAILDGLSYAEKNTYERIKTARSLSEPMFGEELNAGPELLSSIPQNTMRNVREINGRLASVKSDIPVTNQPVVLLDASNNVVSLSRTDSNGQFNFDNVTEGEYTVKMGEGFDEGAQHTYVNRLVLKDGQGNVLLSTPESSQPLAQSNLMTADVTFYNTINPQTRKAIDRSIAAEYLTNAYQQNPSLISQDEKSYKSLSKQEQEYIEVLVKDLKGETPGKNEVITRAIAYSYLRQLPESEKNVWARLVSKEAFNNTKSGYTYQPSAADRKLVDNLSAYEQGIYDRIKEARIATGILVDGTVTADETKNALLKLPEATASPTEMVEVSGNISNTQKGNVSNVPLALQDADGNIVARTTTGSKGQFAFDRTNPGTYTIVPVNPGSTKNTYVSNLAMKNVRTDNILATNEQVADVSPTLLTPETIRAYENLSRAEQKQIDRLIAFEYIVDAYRKDPSLKSADAQASKGLNSQEEKYVKVLTMDLQGQELTQAEQQLLSTAYSYYYNLAPSRKATLNRIISDEIFGDGKQSGNYRLASNDASFKNTMNASTRQMYENIKAFRFNNDRVLSENLEVESRDIGDRQVILNLPSYTNQEYSRLTVTGKLINSETGQPESTKSLRVVDQSGVMIARTFSGSDGTFKFNQIRAGNYHIELEHPSHAGAHTDSYFVKDLEITGTHGMTHAHQRTFNIYYDFNDYQLRPEAKRSLLDLVEIAKQQELYVELKAHTDAIGDHQYNDELSGKRGVAAMDFLRQYGLSADDITLTSYGKSDPIAPNNDEYGRQFNRRVEVIMKSHDPINYHPPTIYLIRPKATLYSISKNFNMSIEEVMRLNGLTEASLHAYKPLRIKNPMGYRPNLDMLVELNESVSAGNSFKYTVKAGENVTTIAEKFNLPEELVLEMNDLTSLNVRKGQVLNIYVRF